MKYRRLLPLLIGVLLLLSAVPVAGAKTVSHTVFNTHHTVHIPRNSGGNCSGGGCWAAQVWPGTVYGASTKEYVTKDHGTYTCNGACLTERDILLNDGCTNFPNCTNVNHAWAGYLWCEDGSSAGSCMSNYSLNNDTLYFTWGYNGTEYIEAVPSGDINNYVLFQVSYYTSSGGGMMWIIDGPAGYFCDGTLSGGHCIWPGAQQSYPDIELITQNSNIFTGALANTALRIDNKWQCYSGCTGGWFYQTSDGSVNRGDNPPWTGWVINNKPSQSSTGGELYDCGIVASSNPC